MSESTIKNAVSSANNKGDEEAQAEIDHHQLDPGTHTLAAVSMSTILRELIHKSGQYWLYMLKESKRNNNMKYSSGI